MYKNIILLEENCPPPPPTKLSKTCYYELPCLNAADYYQEGTQIITKVFTFLCHGSSTLVQFGCHQHDVNGRICGALVQLSCYQHRYEWKDLWCSI